MNSPFPIFVLGIQRTGTTWIANLLAARTDIYAVQAERHMGVHESVFFSHFAKAFGPWENKAAREKFKQAFLTSDYVKLSGLSILEVENINAHSYAEYFQIFMERASQSKEATAWLEKSPHHTMLAQELTYIYPDARFVCITRRNEGLLRSRLWSYGRTPPAYPRRLGTIIRGCASNIFHTRFLEKFCAQNDHAILICFEDLQKDTEGTLKRISRFLSLPAEKNAVSDYKPNSSFNGKTAKANGLSKTDAFIASIVVAFLAIIPNWLLWKIQKRLFAKRKLEFPDWVWSDKGPENNTSTNQRDSISGAN